MESEEEKQWDRPSYMRKRRQMDKELNWNRKGAIIYQKLLFGMFELFNSRQDEILEACIKNGKPLTDEELEVLDLTSSKYGELKPKLDEYKKNKESIE